MEHIKTFFFLPSAFWTEHVLRRLVPSGRISCYWSSFEDGFIVFDLGENSQCHVCNIVFHGLLNCVHLIMITKLKLECV